MADIMQVETGPVQSLSNVLQDRLDGFPDPHSQGIIHAEDASANVDGMVEEPVDFDLIPFQSGDDGIGPEVSIDDAADPVDRGSGNGSRNDLVDASSITASEAKATIGPRLSRIPATAQAVVRGPNAVHRPPIAPLPGRKPRYVARQEVVRASQRPELRTGKRTVPTARIEGGGAPTRLEGNDDQSLSVVIQPSSVPPPTPRPPTVSSMPGAEATVRRKPVSSIGSLRNLATNNDLTSAENIILGVGSVSVLGRSEPESAKESLLHLPNAVAPAGIVSGPKLRTAQMRHARSKSFPDSRRASGSAIEFFVQGQSGAEVFPSLHQLSEQSETVNPNSKDRSSLSSFQVLQEITPDNNPVTVRSNEEILEVLSAQVKAKTSKTARFAPTPPSEQEFRAGPGPNSWSESRSGTSRAETPGAMDEDDERFHCVIGPNQVVPSSGPIGERKRNPVRPQSRRAHPATHPIPPLLANDDSDEPVPPPWHPRYMAMLNKALAKLRLDVRSQSTDARKPLPALATNGLSALPPPPQGPALIANGACASPPQVHVHPLGIGRQSPIPPPPPRSLQRRASMPEAPSRRPSGPDDALEIVAVKADTPKDSTPEEGTTPRRRLSFSETRRRTVSHEPPKDFNIGPGFLPAIGMPLVPSPASPSGPSPTTHTLQVESSPKETHRVGSAFGAFNFRRPLPSSPGSVPAPSSPPLSAAHNTMPSIPPPHALDQELVMGAVYVNQHAGGAHHSAGAEVPRSHAPPARAPMRGSHKFAVLMTHGGGGSAGGADSGFVQVITTARPRAEYVVAAQTTLSVKRVAQPQQMTAIPASAGVEGVPQTPGSPGSRPTRRMSMLKRPAMVRTLKPILKKKKQVAAAAEQKAESDEEPEVEEVVEDVEQEPEEEEEEEEEEDPFGAMVESMVDRFTPKLLASDHNQRFTFVTDYARLNKRCEDYRTKTMVNNNMSTLDVDTRKIDDINDDELMNMVWNLYFYLQAMGKDFLLSFSTRQMISRLIASPEEKSMKIQSLRNTFQDLSKEYYLNYKAVLGHCHRIMVTATSDIMCHPMYCIFGSILFPVISSTTNLMAAKPKPKSFLDAVRKGTFKSMSLGSLAGSMANLERGDSVDDDDEEGDNKGRGKPLASNALKTLNPADAEEGSIFAATVGADDIAARAEEVAALRATIALVLNALLRGEATNDALPPEARTMMFLVENFEEFYD